MHPLEAQLRGWARAVNWRHTQIAVLIGYGEIQPWRVLEGYRRNLHVVLFEPDKLDANAVLASVRPHWLKSARSRGAVYIPGVNGVSVASTIVGLRQIISSICRPGWHAEVTGSAVALERHGLEIFQEALGATLDGQREKLAMEFTTRTHAVSWGTTGLDQMHRVAGRPIANYLEGALQGTPAVIVGAGPSLTRDIGRLEKLQGRALVIATNSAVGPLDDAGIQPDIICAVESRHESIAPVVSTRAWRNAIVIPGIHSHELSWSSPCRTILPAVQSVGAVGAWLCGEFHVPRIQSGGSVSTLAYGLALLLGCDPVILIGCDCAQGTGGRDMHAAGARHDPADAPVGDIEIPRWGGAGTVLSTDALVHYLHWFEARAPEREAAGLSPIINCSRGGASIDGTVEEDMRKVAWRLPRERRDFRTEIEAALDGAPVIPREAVIAGLERQRHEAARLGPGLEDEAKAVIAVANKMIAVSREHRAAGILAGICAGDVEENERYPELPQLVALANLYARTARLTPDVISHIDGALEALREDQREADQSQSDRVDTRPAAAVA